MAVETIDDQIRPRQTERLITVNSYYEAVYEPESK